MLEDEILALSKEFIDLCQAQLNILSYNFFTQESAIYLTETDENQEPKLIPILVYPQANAPYSTYTRPSLPNAQSNSSFNSDLAKLPESWQETKTIIKQSSNFQSPHQLLLPLVYEDTIMGLLAASRHHKEWEKNEVSQVKEIAQTIALACILEQKQQLSQKSLQRQRQLQILADEHLHDFFHQLKNPLTALRTFAKLLLKRFHNRDFDNDSEINTTENIIKQSDRLEDLIEEFSEDWQRINDDNLDDSLTNSQSTSFFLTDSVKKLEAIDLTKLIVPLVNTMTIIAQEKQIEITTEIEDNLPLVFTNPKALIEVVNNLLENAIKYTPPQGKISLEIHQQKTTNNEYIILEINDTGYGIPLQDQQHIFERNYRGIQAKGTIEGTGLGLAIVKELCEQMGIKITLFSPSFWQENQQLNGTTFQLSIPILKADKIF